jgi:hypothetical protein
MPLANRSAGRRPTVAAAALPIIGNLIGDAEPDVQKALSWALRSMAVVDRDAVVEFLERETALAARTNDGLRAWVIRDALQPVPAATAESIRTRLAGIRRQPGARPTSTAAAVADAFYGHHPDLRQGGAVEQGARRAGGGRP